MEFLRHQQLYLISEISELFGNLSIRKDNGSYRSFRINLKIFGGSMILQYYGLVEVVQSEVINYSRDLEVFTLQSVICIFPLKN